MLANVNHPLILHNAFIGSLSSLASDPDPKVRKAICTSLTTIACLHVALLEPYFPSICEFLTIALLDGSEEVAIEACEYWSALLHHVDVKKVIVQYLPRVVPNLITRLYLTPTQMEHDRLEDEEQNSGKR